MFVLSFFAAFIWYGEMFLLTAFLSHGILLNIINVLSQIGVVMLFSYLLTTIVNYYRLFQKKYWLYAIAFLLTGLFYAAGWLGNDFFNYFCLFFTNILYCMVIFYSLQVRSLL